MSESLQIDPACLYRVPLAPASLFSALRAARSLDDTLGVLRGWPLSTEALLLASPTLERECQRPVRRAKTARHLQRSLHGYLIRASTRSVPFGLFAASGSARCRDGRPGAAPKLRVQLTALSGAVAEARPALEDALPPDLRVMLNPTAHVQDGQLTWQPVAGAEQQVPCSAALAAVLEDGHRPVALAQLRDRLSDGTLRALLRADVLLSELQPLLTPTPASAARLAALAGPAPAPGPDYDTLPGPQRVQALRAALGSRGHDGEVQRTLALDAVLDGEVTLPPQVLVELREGVLALQRSPVGAPVPEDWPAFIRAFRRQYGSARVPLRAALALAQTLASPPPAPPPDECWAALLAAAGPTLDLTDACLAALPRTSGRWTVPFDLLSWVLARNAGDLWRGAYTLALLGGSTPDAGQSTARLRAAHPHLPAPQVTGPPGTLVTALCLQHPQAGANDTARCRPGTPLELHVPGHPAVPDERRVDLRDVQVDCGDDQVNLWCARREQRLHLTLPTLTRADHLGPAARWLTAVALQGRTPPHWRWGPLGEREYLPRVTRGRCVLSAASWRFPDHWRAGPDVTDRQVLDWLERLGAPDLLRVGRGDRQLTLDWRHATHRDLLRAEWRRGCARVSEAVATPDLAWFTGHDGQRHLFEGIFTVRP
ncbi:hypothetical protein GCM10008956_11500 [Deinococcus arenae]|uniref:Lantibiotic dehydratase N-terminal domain-containing protein n=1 Tax=Deinococcus arenae TaxID=1452751 RepID=A0A8H9L6Q5_9DEIO|nr:lantibiotic dehydratase [Deinococcus arenae]AWT37563.1 hypothetical protein DM785_17850 [Deinococcus actinosclerus]GGM36704.1 hypothetical protein GCM10008956_11500 [Deinococcus arenae]